MRHTSVTLGERSLWAASVILSILVACTSSLALVPLAVAQPAAVLSVGNPLLVTMGDWRLLNATLQDNVAGESSLILFAVWKDTAGQTVAVETGGVTMMGGETGNCYAPVFNISPGTYHVYLSIWSFYDQPWSLQVAVQVSL